MTGKKIGTQQQAAFDGIRQSDADGNEYWLARQLARVLEYSQYRHFLPVLERAREACRHSGQRVEDHMEDILTMVGIGSGAQREVENVAQLAGIEHRPRRLLAHAFSFATVQGESA